MAGNNRERILGDLLSVEAWFKRLTEENPESEFFLHVCFQEAVFGANPEDKVRFRVRLKRANITIVAEEPFRVPKDKVRRDRQSWMSTIEDVSTREKGGSVEASGTLGFSPAGGNFDLNASAKFSAATSQKQTVTQTVQSNGTNVEHSFRNSSNVWSFSPAVGEHLSGQAFRENVPLMRLRLSLPLPKVSPSVKVVVTCLREDIDILDLEPKHIRKGILQRGMGEERKLKLAEEIIKLKLASSDLQIADLSEKFFEVTIADVLASEE